MTLPHYPEQSPKPPEKPINLSGDVLRAAQELIPMLANTQTEGDVVNAAIGILRQANGRKIQFVDSNGVVTEVTGVWR